MTQLPLLVVAMLGILAGCGSGSSPAAPAPTTTPPPSVSPVAMACSAWAAQQRASGVPPATPAVAPMRRALYDAGGGIRAINNRYYGAYFPAAFGASGQSRVLVALHGTGGSPEAEWVIDWGAELQARGWGFLGLKYVDDSTGVHDNDATIYANIKAMIDEARAACAFGSPSLFLVGFSRGSAEAFPVAYHDLKDRRLFTAIGNNSGSWVLNAPLPATLEAVRADASAFAGGRFWMYCGEQDRVLGFPMCDGMEAAKSFVQARAGSVLELYRDPAGAHGGLNRNPDALSRMFAAFEGL